MANTYHARVHYAPGPSYRAVAGALPEEMNVDARPSDAINLALRFDAPIYISKEVITQLLTQCLAIADPLEAPHRIIHVCFYISW